MSELRYSTHQITTHDVAAVVDVLRSDWLTCGPKVQEFEDALAAYCGAKYAVAVNSGTAALYLAYRAADVAGKTIVTSPLTFMATANAALLAGARWVGFGDVDSHTGDLDPWRTQYEFSKEGAVVPVHYAGRATGIPVTGRCIEDACHALGAMDFDGCSRVGSCAHSLATCFSFHPVKPICAGEGGAVTTNDQGFADEVRSLRSHGRDGAGLMVALSGNFRMPDINAALALSQLKRCDEMRERRADLASQYADALYGCGLAHFDADPRPGLLVVPPHLGDERMAWHLYAVRIKNGRRDEVMAKLHAQGIMVQKHYDPPVHLHPYYRERYGYKPGDFPEAEAWAAEELSLPLHAGMTEADVARVVGALMEALR